MINLDISGTDYQEIITTFVWNTMLHNFRMIWIIEIHEYFKNDTDLKNSDWVTGGPWYNTYICKKLHGKVFQIFIINTITERYNIMCSIHEYKINHQLSSCYDGRSVGSCPIPKNSTTAA